MATPLQRSRCGRVTEFTGLRSNRITNRDLSPLRTISPVSICSNVSSTNSTPSRLSSNQSAAAGSKDQIAMLLEQQKELKKSNARIEEALKQLQQSQDNHLPRVRERVPKELSVSYICCFLS